MRMENFETFAKINSICKEILEGSKTEVGRLKELQQCLKDTSPSFMRVVQKLVFAVFHPYMKNIANNSSCYKNDEKQIIVDTLRIVLDKAEIDNKLLFLNFYSFLVFQIYNYEQHQVLQTSEEYKLSVLLCTISLFKSASTDLISTIYTKELVPNISQMIYIASEIAKNEKSKDLRCCAVNCIMEIAHILDDDDFEDVVMRDHVAELFIFFLPGLSSTLTKIATEDVKIGHKVPMHAIKAFGRIITLIMQDYHRLPTESVDINDILSSVKEIKSIPKLPQKFKDKDEVHDYIDTTTRTPAWYKENDKNLSNHFVKLVKLVNHPHLAVIRELVVMAELIITNCLTTMPVCVGLTIEIIIVLCEHENKEVSQKSREILKELSRKMSEKSLGKLMEKMEDGFYNTILSLPRKFNSLDSGEKLSTLNLILGYVTLFGEHNLNHILLDITNLENLVSNLLFVCELDANDVGLLEEYSIRELNIDDVNRRTPWKKFKHFSEEMIELKIEKICKVLSELGGFQTISDFLLDIILYKVEHKNEAIFLLNSLILGLDCQNDKNTKLIKNIMTIYTDPEQWRKTISINSKFSPNEIKTNIIQACLLTEGIGSIASATKQKFQPFLLPTLYLVIERAGSKNSLVSSAGLSSLVAMSEGLGYKTIEDLVSDNIDYFSYNVERRLNRLNENDSVLDVFAVVLKYSKIDVLQTVDSVVNEVLMRSCDKFNQDNMTAFLMVFKMFIKCLHRWLNIEIKEDKIKTKEEKIKEMEHFQVSGIDNSEQMEDLEETSAEDLYKEDLKKLEESDEIEDYGMQEVKKPEPPAHIKLTVSIINRSLHFLPSKDKNRKLLVLEVLSRGVEVLKDFEDELLPVVHKIWSPLVYRFKDFDEPVIINYSFKLLIVLARLSKDFIRMRTTKEALPSIFQVLDKYAKESYLKDKGSAYRYTQGYKLQLEILEHLAKLLINLDVADKTYEEAMDHIFLYLSEKQPVPLQTLAFQFFKDLAFYDPSIVIRKIEDLYKNNKNSEYTKLLEKLLNVIK